MADEKRIKIPVKLKNPKKVATDRMRRISWTGSKIIWSEVTEFVARGMAMGLLMIDEKAFWRKYKEIGIKEISDKADKASNPEPDEDKKD